MRGRKTKEDSRTDELCRALVAWKQTPESLRPSLRALSRQLGTSHELLRYYLAGLEKWKWKELYRQARTEMENIRSRAQAENRALTSWEDQQIRVWDRQTVRAMVAPMLLNRLEKIKQAAKRGPLDRCQFQMVKTFAKHGLPGAQELLQQCLQVDLKRRKRFADIVKDTPRQEGESAVAWARRIWDECEKYETNCPTEINEQLLEKYARGVDKKHKGNLPEATPENAKSFKSVGGEAGNSAKVEGRRNDAGII